MFIDLNCSPIAYSTPATDLDVDRVRMLFDTNVFGVMSMIQEFVSLLIASQGKIINIGSVAALLPSVKFSLLSSRSH